MFDFLTTQDSVSPASPTIAPAPTSLTAVASSGKISLGWTNGDTYSATVIMRKTTGDFAALTVQAGNATSYDDSAVVNGVTYTYEVRGLKATFPTRYSASASATATVTTAASGTITVIDYTDPNLQGTTFTVNNNGFTEPFDWTIGASNHATAVAIANAINGTVDPGVATASVLGDVVTVLATVPGAAGNSIQFSAQSPLVADPHDGTLAGGAD